MQENISRCGSYRLISIGINHNRNDMPLRYEYKMCCQNIAPYWPKFSKYRLNVKKPFFSLFSSFQILILFGRNGYIAETLEKTYFEEKNVKRQGFDERKYIFTS